MASISTKKDDRCSMRRISERVKTQVEKKKVAEAKTAEKAAEKARVDAEKREQDDRQLSLFDL